jgi:pyrrolidone-carboxylate peptidase
MVLTREQILAASRQIKAVEIKALGGEVNITKLPSGLVLSVSDKLGRKEITDNEFAITLLVASIVDEKGVAVFDAETAALMSSEALQELIIAIADYNKLDIKLAEAKENLKKVSRKHS